MKTKSILLVMIFLLVPIISTASYNKSNQLSTREKIADFQYLYNVIKDGYPYLDVNERRNNIDWLANKNEYITKIKNTKTDEEFIEELSYIVSDLNNRHTQIIDNKNKYESFKKAYENNNWYNFLNDKKVVDRYNYMITKFKLPKVIYPKKELILEDVVKDEVGYIYLPSMVSRNGSTKKDLKIIGNYIDTLDNYKALIIDIRGNLGGSDTYWEGVVSKLIEEDTNIGGYRLYRNNSKVIKRYTKVRKLKLEPIEKINLDIENDDMKSYINNFTDFEKISYSIKSTKSSKFKGNIYVLIDKKVYSSAEAFSMFCKENKFATLVGETTGGDGGGIDPVLFKLKNSGLVARMASCMYLNNKGVCDEEFKTVPDFKMKNCTRTVNFKNDNCIKEVLELEDH
ncbi:MAG: S41 family peptidase [Paraclostridium sp.]|uniref:S41 family peptidase n=1 Tax=Paraclostridium sp. TaxID=2023273 RepID=UPI003F3253A2